MDGPFSLGVLYRGVSSENDTWRVSVRVLALDPSTTCTGFAVLEGLSRDGLVDGGLIRPSASARACRLHEPGWLGEYLLREDGGLAAYRRVVDTIAEVEGLVAEFEPAVVVVEVTSGKVGTGARRGATVPRGR